MPKIVPFGKILDSKRKFFSALPRFEEQPENKTVNLGDTVHFFCRTSGSPVPTVVWYRDNVPLIPCKLSIGQNSIFFLDWFLNHFESVLKNSSASIFDTDSEKLIKFVAGTNRLTSIPLTGTLEIRNVQSTDQGSYKCKIETIDTKYRISKEGRLVVRKVDGNQSIINQYWLIVKFFGSFFQLYPSIASRNLSWNPPVGCWTRAIRWSWNAQRSDILIRRFNGLRIKKL